MARDMALRRSRRTLAERPGEYLPLLLMAILISVLVWAVVRAARTQGGRATIPAASGIDGASQEPWDEGSG